MDQQLRTVDNPILFKMDLVHSHPERKQQSPFSNDRASQNGGHRGSEINSHLPVSCQFIFLKTADVPLNYAFKQH